MLLADVEKGYQLRSRIAQRLGIRKSVSLASTLAAALIGEMRVLARWGARVRTKTFLHIRKSETNRKMRG